MNITIFKNIKDTSAPFVRNVALILERIRNGKSKELIVAIRKEKDKEKRNKLKQDLPAICFSGVFTKREDRAIEQHSGLICLDFDGFKTKKAMAEKKAKLSKDKYVYSVFISPSGNGLKVIVKIPPEVDDHCDYFKALEDYYECSEFDKSCKNISRVCYESFDEELYLNENSEVWTEKKEFDESEYLVVGERPTIRISDHGEVVRRLLKWWEDNFPMVEGERNNNMFVIASAFNKFGVDKSLALYVLGNYTTKGFSEEEIRTTINSAYKNFAEHNTRFFEDNAAVEDIKVKMKSGATDKEIRHELKEKGVGEHDLEEVIGEIKQEAHKIQFWTISSNGGVSIVHNLFKEFLEDNGIYKYSPPGSTAFLFVRVKDNLIENIAVEYIKDFVLHWLYSKGDMVVYNHFADKTRYFKEDFLGMIKSIDAYFIKDDKRSAYIYYNNCAVKVTKANVELVDYIDLGGYVWKDQVIDRDFDFTNDIECDFKKFIHNVAGSDKNILSVESTIGFLLHGFKNQSYCPAVIINDEILSENPEGGTGKGLFVNGISQMKKLVTIDGKAFSFEKSFAYQTLSQDTQTLCFDDVRKSFHFERLFSVVTEGITLEKKNKDAIKIPFAQSPKIIITTNYAIVGKGNSFERRKWELEFRKFYHKNFTPLDEFGRLLFTDWDTEEWMRFDNYMIDALKNYLRTGFIQGEFKNMEDRKLQTATSSVFYEWITNPLNVEDIGVGVKVYQHTLWHSFTSEYTNFDKLKITPQRFGKWIQEYAYYKTGFDATIGKDRNGKYFILHENDPVSVPF